jgi:hypothetical protein
MTNFVFHSMALREYYEKKQGWSSKIINSIWWSTYYRSLSSLSNTEKLCIKKLVNNRWETLSREQKYYKRQSRTSHCGQCKLYVKNDEHIIRCRIATRQSVRDKWRTDITTYLLESHTPKAIQEAICHGFFTWLKSRRNTGDIPPLPMRNREFMKAFELQTTLGWNHFAKGRMVIERGKYY